MNTESMCFGLIFLFRKYKSIINTVNTHFGLTILKILVYNRSLHFGVSEKQSINKHK